MIGPIVARLALTRRSASMTDGREASWGSGEAYGQFIRGAMRPAQSNREP